MGISLNRYIIGVDGGGTGCRAALQSVDGRAALRSQGGPANFTTDPGTTLKNILTTLHALAGDPLFAEHKIEECVAHIGLAGVMDRADQDVIKKAVPFKHLTVSDDRETSVAGALGGHDGILAAIGTGTIIAARQTNQTRYFGGWGHHLSDQASGGWLGRAALRHTMLAYDGLTERTELTTALLAQFRNDPLEIVQFTANAEPGDVAKLAPIVVEKAKAGDAAATRLMKTGAEYIQSCIHVADLPRDTAICLAGGVGPHYETYLDPPTRAQIKPPEGTALDGALRLARAMYDRLEIKT
ncbi:MAG: BadF/BadG/BcrA/BcrD ATPase family protein [Roseobacter sp.]